jgi:hypothetical protein
MKKKRIFYIRLPLSNGAELGFFNSAADAYAKGNKLNEPFDVRRCKAWVKR